MKQLAVAALLLARLAAAQPSLVKDIRTTGPLDASLWPVGFVANGSALYFGTPSGSPQQSQLGGLWKTDGTAAGCVLLHRGEAFAITPFRNRVLFTDHEALWSSDGTTAGTLRITVPGTVITRSSLVLWTSDGTPGGTRRLTDRAVMTPTTSFQGRAFFAGDDGVHGIEPWSSDGTPEGTAMFADLAPNIAPSSQPLIVGAAGNRVVFDATDD